MPAVPVRYSDQPITYAVSAVVAGGQLVDADQSTSQTNAQATVTPSGAGSKICVGCAIRDAAPAGTDSVTDAAARPPNTTVARAGAVVPVTFAAASHFGDFLKTAAAGAVTPWVDGTDDPDLIVAQNVDDSGYIASAGIGYVSLRVS